MTSLVKKKLVWLLAALVIIAMLGWLIKPYLSKKTNQPELKVLVTKVEDGWGYKIAYGDKVIINQEFIPAIQGSKAFKSESDAETIGKLVIEKLKSGQNPSVTIEELKEHHIID